jgi:large subunit ribosomal protein L10
LFLPRHNLWLGIPPGNPKREENHVNRSEKTIVIGEIRAQAASASIAVVTDFKGMSVEELTRLRVKLREAGGRYLVVKNTLARLAFTDSAHDSIKDKFKENCAIALGFDDPVPVAKALSEFAKTSKIFAVRHGSLHGKVLSAAQVEDLARLPSREVLLAQVLGTMNAVPTGFVSLLANIPRGLLNVLKALEEKKAA